MPGTPSTGYSINSFAIDNLQRYPVVAQTYCKRITVQEDYNSATPPTADLKMAAPSGGTLINIPMGTPAIFTPPASSPQIYRPGDVVGDIQTAAGSITVQQVESQQV